MKRLMAALMLSAGCALLHPPPVHAAQANCPGGAAPPVDGVCAITLGASPATILTGYQAQGFGGSGYRLIAVDNESPTASIAVCFGAGCTPALNTAGSYTIPPGSTRLWSVPYGAGGGYNDQMNGVASASSTPVTVEAH